MLARLSAVQSIMPSNLSAVTSRVVACLVSILRSDFV